MNTQADDANYRVTRYEPRLREQVVGLLTQLWGADVGLNDAYFEWKYLNNPYQPATDAAGPQVYVALSAQTVVAVLGYWPSCWRSMQGTRWACLHGADAVVDPAHRNRGLFQQLWACSREALTREAYDTEITLSGNAITTAKNHKAGGRNIGMLDVIAWSRPGDSLLQKIGHRMASTCGLGRRASAPSPFERLDLNYDALTPRRRAGFSLATRSRPEAMASLVEHCGTGRRLTHARDRAYYAWRFENPRSVYRFVFLEQGNARGFLVLRVAHDERAASAIIVDWEADSPAALSQLLGFVIRHGGFQVLETWSTSMAPGTLDVFRRHGFITPDGPAPFHQSVQLLPLRSDGVMMEGRGISFSIADWDLRPVFSDAF